MCGERGAAACGALLRQMGKNGGNNAGQLRRQRGAWGDEAAGRRGQRAAMHGRQGTDAADDDTGGQPDPVAAMMVV